MYWHVAEPVRRFQTHSVETVVVMRCRSRPYNSGRELVVRGVTLVQ